MLHGKLKRTAKEIQHGCFRCSSNSQRDLAYHTRSFFVLIPLGNLKFKIVYLSFPPAAGERKLHLRWSKPSVVFVRKVREHRGREREERGERDREQLIFKLTRGSLSD